METMLETSRLLLRPWRESDRLPFSLMNADPEVMRYFPKMLTPSESDAMIERIRLSFRERGYGLWAAEIKDSGRFIGFIGLNYTDFPADFTPCVEIGWRLAREYWHSGYASEGAVACLKYAFAELGLSAVYSFTSVLNMRSVSVMERIGLKKEGEFHHPNIECGNPLKPHVLYRITKDEFQSL